MSDRDRGSKERATHHVMKQAAQEVVVWYKWLFQPKNKGNLHPSIFLSISILLHILAEPLCGLLQVISWRLCWLGGMVWSTAISSP